MLTHEASNNTYENAILSLTNDNLHGVNAYEFPREVTLMRLENFIIGQKSLFSRHHRRRIPSNFTEEEKKRQKMKNDERIF